MVEWLSMLSFDPSPGGAFVATYSDGSGARIFLATDAGAVLDGEDMEPCENIQDGTYGLYAWLPDDFITWGQSHG
jgi:hypothetical protein